MKLERALTVTPVVALLVLGVGIAAPAAAGAQPSQAQTSPCGEECLVRVMDRFLAAMLAGKAEFVPLVPDAEVRENTQVVPLAQTAWKDVKTVRSVMTFADPVTANVVSRAGVETAAGRPGYISTRLKVVGADRITDVELSSDTSPAVAGAYVWNLDPQLSAVLPPERRMSRTALEALARRYFNSLSSHVAVPTDFDDRCNRFHSGRQVTNTTSTVEAGPPRTCASALEGNPPWGPATDQRFPVIDPERGIVLGVTLLHFPTLANDSAMYVSELFKVEGGKIVKIDNIGLMLQGVSTLGFAH